MKKIHVLMLAVIVCFCFISFTFATKDVNAMPTDNLPVASDESDFADPLDIASDESDFTDLLGIASDKSDFADLFGIAFDELDPADMADMVEAAVHALAEEYTEFYRELNLYQAVSLDIRSTRVICIKDELDESQEEFIRSVQEEYFGDVRYIIEFLLYEDSISGGLYSYPASEDVIIHDDGSMEWVSGYLDKYRGRTFSVDYSGFIEQVIDLHDQCNQVIRFQGEEIIFEK